MVKILGFVGEFCGKLVCFGESFGKISGKLKKFGKSIGFVDFFVVFWRNFQEIPEKSGDFRRKLVGNQEVLMNFGRKSGIIRGNLGISRIREKSEGSGEI